MSTQYTSLLGFALPVTGELNGTWGDVVNDSITQLVEDSVAGQATASVTGGDWTLTTTGSGAQNQARCAIIIPTGTPGVSRNIIAPASSKAYVVINQSDAAVVLKGSATTGVTIAAGSKVLCAWNGTDFVQVGNTGTVTAVSVATANGLAGTSSGGATPALTLSTTVTGMVKGNGTALSAASAGTDYAPATSGSSILYGNGSGGFSNVTVGSGVNFSGGTLSATGSGGTVTAVSVASANGFAGTSSGGTTPALTLSTSVTGVLKGNGTAISAAAAGTDYVAPGGALGTPSSGTLTNCSGLPLATGVSGTLAVTNGGTGQTSYTDGQLLIGNSTGNTLAKATLTQGTGITITNGSGSITIANSGLTTYPSSGIAVSTGSAWGTSKASPTGDIVGTTDTQTLTNKRVTPRVNNNGATTSGTITPTGDSSDQYELLGLTGTITVAAPSGTPTAGQKLILRFKDNGTGRTINWTTTAGGYRVIGTTLPTTTTASKNIYVGCIYNNTDSYWDVVAVTSEV